MSVKFSFLDETCTLKSMNAVMSLIYRRWAETIGYDQKIDLFKERCEMYSIDENDELRIRDLEHAHNKTIIEMIKGNLDQSISELGKVYGFSAKERVKWSEFFLGYKQVYESICPECNYTHLHYSKLNASSICNVCSSHQCIICGSDYVHNYDNSNIPRTSEKCCSLTCFAKLRQEAVETKTRSFFRRLFFK